MEYKLKYSLAVKIISAVVLLGMGALLYFYASNTELNAGLRAFVVPFLGVGFLYPIISMPLSVVSNEEGITLKRLCWTSHYKISEYEISERCPESIDTAIRAFGSGGYFGYRGYFHNRQNGFFKLTQTGNQSKYFCLRRHGKKRYHYIAYA